MRKKSPKFPLLIVKIFNMIDNFISTDSFLLNYISDPSEVQFFEQELSLPVSNRKKIRLIQKIIQCSKKQLTAENHAGYPEWLEKILEMMEFVGSGEAGNNAFFSQHDDIRNFVMKSLKSAKKDLKICMFTISDDPIAETVAGCHKQGINVRIITDDGKVFDKGSDIYSLSRMGIKIKMDTYRSLMHHKFVIIDNQKLLTGSYNWTKTGSDFNNENVLITDNNRIVKAYKKEFKRLWSEMKPLPQ
jgi:phosphatidylserine/phosphatidylglycerophosphate/cardiolipin synthase-like enzyme